MSNRVQLATLQELKSKAGKTYMKGAFGPFDLLLFRDDLNSSWSLVMSQNSMAMDLGRPMPLFVEVEVPSRRRIGLVPVTER